MAEGIPTNQLIIKPPELEKEGVGERSECEIARAFDAAAEQRDLRMRLDRAGEVIFLKAYPELRRTIAIFGSTEGAHAPVQTMSCPPYRPDPPLLCWPEATAAKRNLEEAGFQVFYGLVQYA